MRGWHIVPHHQSIIFLHERGLVTRKAGILIRLVRFGTLRTIKYLMRNDEYRRVVKSRSLLSAVQNHENANILRYLLENFDLDVNAVFHGYSLLETALDSGNADSITICRILLEYGAVVDESVDAELKDERNSTLKHKRLRRLVNRMKKERERKSRNEKEKFRRRIFSSAPIEREEDFFPHTNRLAKNGGINVTHV